MLPSSRVCAAMYDIVPSSASCGSAAATERTSARNAEALPASAKR
jgi:hypothetical protein